MEETWKRSIEVCGEVFELLFIRRPFREGLEVHVTVHGTAIRLAELGLGERALIERATARIEEELHDRKGPKA